jgi:hypothetical protein
MLINIEPVSGKYALAFHPEILHVHEGAVGF